MFVFVHFREKKTLNSLLKGKIKIKINIDIENFFMRIITIIKLYKTYHS